MNIPRASGEMALVGNKNPIASAMGNAAVPHMTGNLANPTTIVQMPQANIGQKTELLEIPRRLPSERLKKAIAITARPIGPIKAKFAVGPSDRYVSVIHQL